MKRPFLRWFVRGCLLILVVLFSVVGYLASTIAGIGSGHKAKLLCSGVFVSQRAAEDLLSNDLKLDDYPIFDAFPAEIDRDAETVTVSYHGLFERTAVYRPDLGCTLLIDKEPQDLDRPVFQAPTWQPPQLPLATAVDPAGIDPTKMKAAVDWAFSEPTEGPAWKTRAVVILHKGQIVAERYAPGIEAEMALPGWSMSKSVLAALVGIRIGQGEWSLDANRLLPQWDGDDDTRGEITVQDLIWMSDGLAFDENYNNPLSDVIRMLWDSDDMSVLPATQELVQEPGTVWRYSSGTSVMLAAALRGTFTTNVDALRFPKEALFDPAGMKTAVFETDAVGNLVGGSYVYASARDWARFGQLYLQDGVWNERRVLPEGWVDFCLAVPPSDVSGIHGAHWWLQLPIEYTTPSSPLDSIPGDAYHAVGHEGQVLSVIPSKELVVVRLGLTRGFRVWDQPEFLARILDAVQ